MTLPQYLNTLKRGDDIQWTDAFGLPCRGTFIIRHDDKITVQSDDERLGVDTVIGVGDLVFGGEHEKR